jgi:ZIP family zinc transporter
MNDTNIWIALLLTALAGLATTIGSLIGVAVRKPGPKLMGFMLGFSAGVMIFVSFVELLPKGVEAVGFIQGHIGFFIGLLGFFLIDTLVPHNYLGDADISGKNRESRLRRTGLLIALGIGVHNFPEGMATFVGALKNFHLGIAIALAIAIHNIPEGLAVSAPVYSATGSRKKAFFWSFSSGMSEPLGAGLAALILMPILTEIVLGWMLAFVAGIMVAISVDELIPVAKSFDTEHLPFIGIISGMFIMALSLLMLK